ncbi:MAG: DNA polymerase III subunit delta' [Clostridia bacterium]|nr:DNA polymerase III subunit delta' [Clostridia bacterium]
MSFPLVGNARLAETAARMIASGHFPHAMLIEGEMQTGRHTLANYLARAAVCDGNAGKPCNSCKHCRLAQAGNHPDISVIAPEEDKKNISVKQARELRNQAWIRPHMADRRVFLIDRAETLNEQAQNALLKILEEPPEGVIFILIAAGKAQLLETVVSRCTVLSVSVPKTEEAFGYLQQHTKKSDEEIQKALAAAGNRIGRALTLLGKRTEDKTVVAAAEFLRLLFAGDAYALLTVLKPFEKDRGATELLFHTIREEAATEMRRRINNRTELRLLTALNEEIYRSLGLLKTNINLPLLFSALVCKMTAERNR